MNYGNWKQLKSPPGLDFINDIASNPLWMEAFQKDLSFPWPWADNDYIRSRIIEMDSNSQTSTLIVFSPNGPKAKSYMVCMHHKFSCRIDRFFFFSFVNLFLCNFKEHIMYTSFITIIKLIMTWLIKENLQSCKPNIKWVPQI